MLEVGVKLLTNSARLPERAMSGDAGLDLFSDQSSTIPSRGWTQVGCGIALEIPEGLCGLVLPRSGLAFRRGITVLNSPGLIDSGYRGEIKVLLINHSGTDAEIDAGDRIAQLVILGFEAVELVAKNTLSQTERGVGGFGHSGR